MCRHERRQQSLHFARWAMGRLLVGGRTQEGSSQWRAAGDTVQGGGDLRGELGQRRHHRVRDSPERGLVAGVGGWRYARSAHDPSAGRVQSSVAPRAARRPRCDFHDLDGGEPMGQHTGRRAVPGNGRADRPRRGRGRWALCLYGTPGLRPSGSAHGRSLRPWSTRRHGRRNRAGGRRDAGREPRPQRHGQYAGRTVHGLRDGGARLCDGWCGACG